jgi:hypothetical protein
MNIGMASHFSVRAWLLAGGVLAITSAQAQSSATTTAPDTEHQTAAATAPPSTGPSPETLKKAKQLGMRPEVEKNGTTLYCWEDATTGTRFKTKKCIDEGQLDAAIEQRQLARDQAKKALGCGSICGSIK